MSKLLERYPHTKRIQEPSDAHDIPDTILELIQPYLDWQVGEIDEQTNILLFRLSGPKPTDKLDESLVILLGEVAKVWLRQQSQGKNWVSAS